MSRRRKILIAIGVAFVVAIAVPVIRHYQLRFAVESYIAELKAKGEPMDLAQVIPPPVPPEQNSADTFRNAAALLDADKSLLRTSYAYGMRMVAPGRAMTCWQQLDVRDSDATNSWEDVKTAVTQNGKSFALLQQIIEKPDFDFQLKYGQGIDGLNFTNLYLAESKRATQRLQTAALCDLHRGDTDSAVKNLRAMLALVKAMRDERFVISELVRMAIAQIALTINWEILQSPNPTDGQLAELQNDWMSLDFIQGCENALAMERISERINAAELRSSNSKLQDYFGTLFKPAKEKLINRVKFETKVFRWRYWWSYPDELRLVKGYQVLLETTRFGETNYSLQTVLHEQENKLQKLGINAKSADSLQSSNPNKIDLHSVMSASAFSLSRFFVRTMRAETTRQITITAIALKRYQLKHGNYPPNLSALVPEFTPAVSRDPVDGEPLRYRLNADGTFLLYSIGENGVDDGGDPRPPESSTSRYPSWPNGRDWVWPQAATAEEIQAYYASKAKK